MKAFLRLAAILALFSGMTAAHAAEPTPAALQIVSGVPQYAGNTGPLTYPWVIRVFDAQSLPMKDVRVRFEMSACWKQPDGDTAEVITDASGRATYTPTADTKAEGLCVCRAIVPGTPLAVDLPMDVVDTTNMGFAPVPESINVAAGTTFYIGMQVLNANFTGREGIPVVFEVQAAGAARPASIGTSTITNNTGHGMTFGQAGNAAGTYTVVAKALGRSASIRFNQTVTPSAVPFVQGIWWGGAAENGWGMSIVQHNEKLFIVIYGYDAAGSPTWWVVPEGFWNPALTEYTGLVYTPRGSRFDAYDASHFVAGLSVGAIRVTFASPNSARVDYLINGVTGAKQITQLAFGLPGPPGPPLIPGAADMYWGGVAQNGWGVSIAQQFNDLFSVWYTYDANGAPTWFVMPHGTYVQGGGYEGRLFRSTGSPWLGSMYDASRFVTIDVGSFRMRFNDNMFDYTVDGRSGSMPFTKTPF